jgi:spore germination protein YaaH
MKKKVIPAIIIIALIFVIGGIYAGQLYLQKYSYSTEKADLNDYFDISSDSEVAIILGDEKFDKKARNFDGHLYLEFPLVQELLNDRFYFGAADNTLLYTLPDRVITAQIGSTSWSDSEGGFEDLGYVIARMEEGEEGQTLFVALDYVQKYTNFDYEFFDDGYHMQLTTRWEEQNVATINKDTQLRIRGGVKSEVLEELKKGDSVVVLEELENWSKVKSSDSFIGYVENKRLADIKVVEPIPASNYTEPEYAGIHRDHKINLGFHNIGGAGGNDTLEDYIAGTKSLNAISPTWFYISASDGSVASIASKSYVDRAHSKGLEVWALFNNFNGGEGISTSEALATAENRARMITTVIDECVNVGVDGLNLDFETIANSDGQNYIQFVRELSIACRKNGLVFSIDNYVPMNFNDHYKLEEQGVVADYVIIMGYDEHYAGSPEAGSVASLGYVENGIIKALDKVPASKVINAVPFYTRIWDTVDGKVSSSAVTLPVAKEYIKNHSIQMNWDAEVGQNYGEYTDGKGLHQIWMEDTQSLTQKIQSMQLHDIAGIAEWSLGMETSDMWDVIAAYING